MIDDSGYFPQCWVGILSLQLWQPTIGEKPPLFFQQKWVVNAGPFHKCTYLQHKHAPATYLGVLPCIHVLISSPSWHLRQLEVVHSYFKLKWYFAPKTYGTLAVGEFWCASPTNVFSITVRWLWKSGIYWSLQANVGIHPLLSASNTLFQGYSVLSSGKTQGFFIIIIGLSMHTWHKSAWTVATALGVGMKGL